MTRNTTIEGDIKEYCIACLGKSQNMYNLIENSSKRLLFSTLFNIEFTNYNECPQFLCGVCDMKLNAMHDFQENVRKCLIVLKEFNENLKMVKIEEQHNRVESEDEKNFEAVYNETNAIKEDITNEPDEKVYQRIDTSKIEAVSAEEVNQIIEEFKNRLSENKTCVLCGYFAANRRAISSHMALFHKDEKNSWCLECNDIFENYEEHKQTHNSKHECPFCKKEFNQSHYVEHLQSHAGTFECEFCKKTFKSAGWLTKHIRIHTNDKPYVCPNCSKCFIQLGSLRYHIVTHGKFACNSCKKHYKTKKDLTEHNCGDFNVPNEIWIKSEQLNENDSEVEETIIIKGSEAPGNIDSQNFCKECNKRVKSLNQHYKKYHIPKTADEIPKVKEKQCTLCQKTFSNAYKLKVHNRTHTGVLPYKCKYCDKRTINRTQLNDHERTHTKEKPYICNVCGKALSQASALRTHMKQHTGRPEVCALCNKRFCRKSELKLHLSKHMGEKPFLCTECGKTFAQKSHLTEHMAGHSDARPFQCLHCEKAFKKKILLKEHMKLHKGYKPYQCPSCSYACYKAYRLQQHMKQHI